MTDNKVDNKIHKYLNRIGTGIIHSENIKGNIAHVYLATVRFVSEFRFKHKYPSSLHFSQIDSL